MLVTRRDLKRIIFLTGLVVPFSLAMLNILDMVWYLPDSANAVTNQQFQEENYSDNGNRIQQLHWDHKLPLRQKDITMQVVDERTCNTSPINSATNISYSTRVNRARIVRVGIMSYHRGMNKEIQD